MGIAEKYGHFGWMDSFCSYDGESGSGRNRMWDRNFERIWNNASDLLGTATDTQNTAGTFCDPNRWEADTSAFFVLYSWLRFDCIDQYSSQGRFRSGRDVKRNTGQEEISYPGISQFQKTDAKVF